MDYETELVVRICRLGKSIPERFAYRYYDAVTVGIDFTARDWQREARQKGMPWEICKGFDGSAVIGEWVEKEKFRDVQALHFHLDINGKTVQEGLTSDMLYTVDELVSYISQFFTLKTGDLLYTGTPVGVGPVHIDDHLEGWLEDRKVLEFNCKSETDEDINMEPGAPLRGLSLMLPPAQEFFNLTAREVRIDSLLPVFTYAVGPLAATTPTAPTRSA